MDAKAPAAVTTFQRGCDARGHRKAMAVARVAKTFGAPGTASARLKRPSAT